MKKNKRLPFILNAACFMCELCAKKKCKNRKKQIVWCKQFVKDGEKK